MFDDKEIGELERMLMDEREKLRQFRFVMSGGKSKNVKEGKRIRKETARIQTALRQKQIAARRS